jgi:hypothetical protein
MRSLRSRQLMASTCLATLVCVTAGGSAAAQERPAPAASAPLWGAHADIVGRTAHEHSAAGVEFFVPLLQNQDSMIFIDAGINGDFDSEVYGTFGLGYRKIVTPDLILGGIVALDVTRTDDENTFGAISLGAEAIGTSAEARINVQLPFSGARRISDETVAISQPGTLTLLDNRLVEQAANRRITVDEVPLTGVEGEIGINLPIGFDRLDDQLKAFAGAYHYGGDGVDSFTGVSGRLEYSVRDIMGDKLPGAELILSAGLTHDDEHGTNFAGEARLRIPLGVPARTDASARTLSPLEERMTQRVVRTTRIQTSERTRSQVGSFTPRVVTDPLTGRPLEAIYFADGADTPGQGTADDPTTLGDAVQRAGAGGTIVAEGNNGTIDTPGVTLAGGQRLVGGGVVIPVQLADGTITSFQLGQIAPVIVGIPTANTITLGANNRLQSLTITGGLNGIAGTNVGALALQQITIGGSAAAGISIVNNAGTSTLAVNGLAISGVGGPGIAVNGLGGGSTTVTGFSGVAVASAGGGGVLFDGVTFDADPQTPGFQRVEAGGLTIGDQSNPAAIGGDGLRLNQVAGDLAFTSLLIANADGTGLFIRDRGGPGGDFSFGNTGGAIRTAGGAALDVDPVLLAARFGRVSSTNAARQGSGGADGVFLDRILARDSGAPALVIDTLSISGAAGNGLVATNNAGNLVFGATSIANVGGTGIVLANNTGTVTFADTAIANPGAGGIDIAGINGRVGFGNVDITGLGAGKGLDLTDAAGYASTRVALAFQTLDITGTGVAGSVGIDYSGTTNSFDVTTADSGRISGVGIGIDLRNAAATGLFQYGDGSATDADGRASLITATRPLEIAGLNAATGVYNLRDVAFAGDISNISGVTVFYVDADGGNNPAIADGTAEDPGTLAQAAASGADVIALVDNQIAGQDVIDAGAAIQGAPGSLRLGDGQRLISFLNEDLIDTGGGRGVPANLLLTGIDANIVRNPRAGSGAPRLTTTEGGRNTLVLGNNNTLTGVVIDNGAGAAAVFGNGIGGLTFRNSQVSSIGLTATGGTGRLENLAIGQLAVTGGSIALVGSNADIAQAGSGAALSVGGGHTGSITFDAASSISASSGIGLRFNQANGIYDFGGPITLGGGANIAFSGAAGRLSFADTTISNPVGNGIDLAGTNGAISFGNVAITGVAAGAVALDFNGAALTGAFSARSLVASGAGGTPPAGSIGIDLRGVTGGQTIRIGVSPAPNPALDTPSRLQNLATGVFLDNASNAVFTFGDGEDATDQASRIVATTRINAASAPTLGSYNFLDVDFQGAAPGAGFVPATIYYFSETGTGTGATQFDPGSIGGAEASGADLLVPVGTAQINAANGGGGGSLDLASAQQLRGFQTAGGTIDAGFAGPATIQISAISATISDLTGSGSPTLTTSAAGQNVVNLASGNTLSFISTTGGASGIAGSGINNLAARNVSIAGTTGDGIALNGTSGNVAFTGTTSVTRSGGTGVSVAATGGIISFATLSVNNAGATPTAGGGVSISGPGSFTFTNGLAIATTSGAGFTASGGATISVAAAGTRQISTTTGQILNLNGVTIGAGGVSFASLTSSGTVAADAINLTGVAGGSFTGGAVTIAGTSGAGSDGIEINGSSAAFSFGATTIDNSSGRGIALTGANGAVSFASIDIDEAGGAGLSISGNTNAVTITGGTIGTTATNQGAVLISGGSGTITVGASTVNSAGTGISVTGRSAGTTTFSGTHTQSGTGLGVNLANSGGTVSFTNTLNLGGTGGGIAATSTGGRTNFGVVTITQIGPNAGIAISAASGAATYNFNGQTTVTTTGGTGTGVALSGAGASTVSFLGGLSINTATGAGFTASGGATISVAAAGTRQIATTTGQILNLNGVTIGTGGVSFASLASSGTVAADAINLTGVAGGSFNGGNVTIAGTSGATSDGIEIVNSSASFGFGAVSLANVAARGIALTGANGAVSFASIGITGGAGRGVEIFGATNNVTFNGGSIGPAVTAGFPFRFVVFNQAATSTISLSNVDITGNASSADLFNVQNSAGTITVAGGTFSQASANDTVGISGGSAAITIGANLVHTGTGNAVRIDGTSGTIVFNGTIGNSGGGRAFDIGSGTTIAGGSITFNGAVSDTGSSGVRVQNLAAGAAVAVTAPLTVINATADALSFTNNAGTLSFAGVTASTTGTARAIAITGAAGSATYSFNGQVALGQTGSTGAAVAIDGAATHTVSFLGGLGINDAAGAGFTASGGATINVAAAGASQISTKTGQILNLNGVTIGAGGMSFIGLASTDTVAADAINITGVAGGSFAGGTVTIAGTSGAGSDGIEVNGSSATFGFGTTTIGQTGGNGILLSGNGGAVSFADTTIGNPAGNGIDLAGTNGAISFGNVAITGVSAGAVALDFNGAALTGAFSARSLVASGAGGTPPAGSIGIDLRGVTGGQTIRIGVSPAPNPATDTPSRLENFATGVFLDNASNAVFTFGDGEDAIDQASFIRATTRINAASAPTLGSYNFLDVDFEGAAPGAGFVPATVYYFSETGTGTGATQSDPGSIGGAEASGADLLVPIGTAQINAANGGGGGSLDLASAQQLRGFQTAGGTLDAGFAGPATIQISAISATISDLTGNGSPTLTTSAAGQNVVNLSSGNTLSFISTTGGVSGIAGSGINNLAARNVSVANTGGAGIALATTSGNVAFTGTTSVTASGGTGVSVAATGGTISFATLSVNNAGATPTAGGGVAVSGPGSFAFNNGLAIATTSGAGFTASGGATISVAAAGTRQISTTTGQILNLNGVTIGAGGLNFATLASNGAATAMALTNVGSSGGGTISIGQATLAGVTLAGVDVSGTLGAGLDFGGLAIGLNGSGTAFDLSGAILGAAVTAGDFDVTNAGARAATLGFDLRGLSGGQVVRLGDPAAGGQSSTMAGFATGVAIDDTSAVQFTYGDGESAVDTGSSIEATVRIAAPGSFAAGAVFNFRDLPLDGSPGTGFGLGRIYFVDSDGAVGGGDGSGRDGNNPATLAMAESLSAAGDIIVLVNNGAVITAAGTNADDTLTLLTGEQLRGFGSGAINLALTVPAPIQLSSSTVTLADPTPPGGGGAATLTSAAGADVVTLGASGNLIDGFILDGNPAGAARGIKDNGSGAVGTTISHMTIQNFTTRGVDIAGASGTTTLNDLSIADAGGLAFTNAAGTVNATKVYLSGANPLSINGGNAGFTFDAASSVVASSGTAVTIAGRTGGSFSFAGAVTANGAGTSGIAISGATAADTISFTGTVDLGAVTPLGGVGVSVDNNGTASTVSFADLHIRTGAAAGFTASGGGTLAVAGGTVGTATGRILNWNGVGIGAGGVTFSSLAATGIVAADAILLSNVDGGAFSGGAVTIAGTSGASSDGIEISGGSSSSFAFTSATIANAAANGLNLDGANGAVSFGSVTIDGSGGAGIRVAGTTATVDINGGSVGGTTVNVGPGVLVENTLAGSDVTFRFVDVTANGADAYTLSNNAGGVTTMFGSATQTGAGDGLDISGGSGTVCFGSDITHSGSGAGDRAVRISGTSGNIQVCGSQVTKTNGGLAVEITGTTGGAIRFDAAVNASAGAGGVAIGNNSGGSTTFANTVTLSTGAADGVTLTNNNPAYSTAFNNGLQITTTSGRGFAATNGGTLSVAAAGTRSISTATGRILDWNGLIVGGGNVAFQSLGSSGVVPGDAILLSNVDGGAFSGGAVTVAGTSGAGSDGIEISGGSSSSFNFTSATISNAAGNGLNLNGANGAVSFDTVSINGSAAAAVSVNGNTNAVTISGGSIGGTTTNASGVVITGGTGAVNIAAAIANSSGAAVSVTGGSGALTFGGSIGQTAAASAVSISGFAGTANFNGAITAQTGTANAIDLVGNTGGTIGFGGTLDLQTAGGLLFRAVDGGTLAITGTSNQMSTTGAVTARGIRIGGTGMTIAAGGANFGNVTVDGSGGSVTSGIVIDNTGGGNVTFGTVSISRVDGAAGNAIRLDNVSGGTYSFGSTTIGTVTGGGAGFDVNASTANVSVASLSSSLVSGADLRLTGNSGTIAVNGGTIQNTQASAVAISGGSAAITIAAGVMSSATAAAVTVDGTTSGSASFTGTLASSGTGNLFEIGSTTAPTGGAISLSGTSLTATGGGGAVIAGLGAGASFNASAPLSVTGASGIGLSIANAAGAVGFSAVTVTNSAGDGIALTGNSGAVTFTGTTAVTNPGASGVRIAGSNGAISFANLQVTLGQANTTGFDLSGATVANPITAGDFDVAGGGFAGTLGINLVGATGTGTIQLGNTINNNPAGQTSTITNVARGVLVSSATSLGNFVYGDGAAPAESSIATFGGGRVIDATDSLPLTGSYNFLDAVLTGDVSNLASSITYYYVDNVGTGDGSRNNPGNIANAAGSGRQVIVLVDNDGVGADTITAGATLALGSGQALVSFRNGTVDLTELGFTGGGAPANFQLTGVPTGGTTLTDPTGGGAPVLTTTAAAPTVTLAGAGSNGISGVVIDNGGGGDGISGSNISSLILQNSTVSGGAAASGVTLTSNVATTLSLSNLTLRSGTGAPALSINGTGGTTTITRFANINVEGGAGTGSGIAVTGATFDADTATGGYQPVAGGNSTIGSGGRVNGNGLAFTNVLGRIDYGTLNIANDSGTGLLVQNPKANDFTLTNTGGSVDTTNGTAVNLDPLTVGLTFGSVDATGGANGIVFDQVAGTFNVTGATSVTGTSGYGITAINTNTGTFTFNTLTVNNGSTAGGGVNVASGTLNFAGNTSLTTAGGTGINQSGGTIASTAGTVAVSTGAGTGIATTGGSLTATNAGNTLSSTAGAAAILNGSTANLLFFSTSSGGTPAANISLTNVAGSLEFGDGSLVGSTGTSVLVNGGTAGVSYAGLITSGTGQAVEINGRTGAPGAITLSSPISHNVAGARGIYVHGNSGGTITFSGPTKLIATTTANAVELATNTGATINFTGGVLALATASGTGLLSDGTGTLTIAGGGSSITTATGIAVSVNGGSGDITSDAALTTTGAGRVASIQNRTGGAITLSGNIATSGTGANAGTGLLIQNNTGGTTTFSGSSKVISTETNTALTVTASTGHQVSFSNTTDIDSTSANAVVVTNGGSLAFFGIPTINATSGTGFLASGTGTLTVAGNAQVSATTGVAVNLSGAIGGVSFNSVSKTDSGGTNGIILNGVTGGTIDLGSGSLVGGAVAVFRVGDGAGGANTGGNAPISYAGIISNVDTGRAVDIQDRQAGAGAITLSGGISHSVLGQTGIFLDQNAGGVITFSGPNKIIQSGSAAAVNLTNNTGATVNFTNGNLWITTASGTGFLASGGGTVAVTGANNTITTNTGILQDISGITIGAGGIGFASQDAGVVAGGAAIRLNALTGGTYNGGTVTIGGTGGAFAGIDILGATTSPIIFGTTTIGGAATTGGAGIAITGSAAVTLSSVQINNTTGAGIAVTGNTGAIAVQGGAIGNTNDPTAQGVVIAGGNANVTVAAAITKTTPGRITEVSGRTAGTVTFSGALSATGGFNNGILVQNNTGGTVTFSGATKTLTTGANPAVTLTNNTGATMNFINGGLAISTTSGAGFNATGPGPAATSGGTVTVQGGSNTISSGTGTALNVANTTIGGAGLTFQSISANGGTNGIVLNNTGALGGLTVTGTGSANTGGTIQNMTGAGVSLTNTRNVSFDRVQILNTALSGIQGTAVTNFAFTNGTINNSGTNQTAGLSNIAFNSVSSGINNVDGVVSVTGSTLTNAYNSGIQIYNESGTISSITISNNTMTGSGNTATSKGSGVQVDINGSGGSGAAVLQGTLNANVINGFASGAGIQFQGGNGALGPAVTLGQRDGSNVPGTGTNIIAITNNQIGTTGGTANIGTNAIAVGVSGTGEGNFRITGNATAHFLGIGVSAFGGNRANVNHYIDNNTIDGSDNIANSSGMAVGSQLGGADSTQTGTIRAIISNNQVSGMEGVGILAGVTNSYNTGYFKIVNNTVGNPTGAGFRSGIRVESGSSSGDATVFLEISGNTSGSVGANQPGISLRKQGSVAGVNEFHIEGLAPSPASHGQVEAFVGGQNTGSVLGLGNDGVTPSRVLSVSGENYLNGVVPF